MCIVILIHLLIYKVYWEGDSNLAEEAMNGGTWPLWTGFPQTTFPEYYFSFMTSFI